MNVDAAYAQFGGRVALMYCLRELGGNAGIDVARFGGVDHETVGRLRAYAEEAWQQLGDARLFDDAFIEQTLAPFTEPFDNGIGLPVLKLSYLDNRNPDALSFAGVGATSIPRNQITSLSRCFCATIRGLGRPYARYYRKQHPEFESDATGLMIMEHLPTKDIWGTAWTHGSQLVLEVQSKLRGSYHARIASTDDARRIAGESRERVPLFESIQRIRALAADLPPSDIEYCIDEQGLMLSQWRPIPLCSRPRLVRQFGFGPGDCPPPYASSRAVEGVLRCVSRWDNGSADAWVECIARALRENDVLLVRYGLDSTPCAPQQAGRPACVDDLASLFDVLYATSEAGIAELPPLLIALDSNVTWGHLHAVLAEDKRVSFAGYVLPRQADELIALEGRSILVEPNKQGWMEVRGEHASV